MDSSSKNKTKALSKNTDRSGIGANSPQATTRKELVIQEYRQNIRDLVAYFGPVIVRIAIEPEAEALEATHQAIAFGEDPEKILIAIESRAEWPPREQPGDILLRDFIPLLRLMIEIDS